MKHRNRIGLIYLPLLVAFGALGCKTEQSVMAGRWQDSVPTTMILNADGTFQEGEGATASYGKWTISGNNITMSVEKIGDLSLEEAIKQMPTFGPTAIPAEKKEQAMEEMKHMHLVVSPDKMSIDLIIPGSNRPDKFKRADL